MIHCPYCGIEINDDEVYCFKCGHKIPDDLGNRKTKDKFTFKRTWLLPIGLFLLFTLIIISSYMLFEKRSAEAEKLYKQSEEKILENEYDDARDLLEKSLQLKSNFQQAEVALEFITKASYIQDDITKAKNKLLASEFNEALSLINESERDLRGYRGKAVTHLIDQLSIERNEIKLESVKNALKDNPSIDDLKILLWEAEAIKTENVEEIIEHIRNQIVDYTYSKAIEQLNKHQFSNAQILIDDGLKYAINSEKLLSLETTIKKEKKAFETAQQQRIEQAIHLAEEEREVNEMEAVKLQKATVTRDEQQSISVEGVVKSVATVPIHSVVIEYTLLDKSDSEILTNKAFIFPDTLYPNETGKFEFTHFEVDERIKNIDIEVNKLTWYTK